MKKSVSISYFIENTAKIVFKDESLQQKTSLAGLLSLSDGILEMPIDKLLQELSLDKDIKDALRGVSNPIKELLDVYYAIESGNPTIVDNYVLKRNLDKSVIYNIWIDSLAEYDKFLNNLKT